MATEIQQITFGVILFLSVGLTASSQEPSGNNRYFDDSDNRLINCEQYSVDIDRMRTTFSELIGRSDFLILIARLGKGEKNKELNRRRLHNVRERLKAAGIESEKLVTAEGECVNGLGRIELYAGGRMIENLRVKRNKDICVECCGDDERFYPYRGLFELKSKQHRRRQGRG